MNTSAPILLSITVFMITIALLLTIWLTMAFDATYVRDATSTSSVNGTGDNAANEWPFKMHLRMGGFFCNVPSPHFNVTEDQLTDAWRLPHRSRLSPIMREMAHCKLAVDWARKEKRIVYESRSCFCADLGWVMAVFVIGVAACTFYNYHIFCRPVRKMDMTNPEVLRMNRCGSALWALIWYVAICAYAMRNFDAGISYTPYGDLYPYPYYHKEPINWFIICLFSFINCGLEGINFVVYTWLIKKRERELARS